MERLHQTPQIVSETRCVFNPKPNDLTSSAVTFYDDLIEELDAIFDHIHGGRAARYSSQQH